MAPICSFVPERDRGGRGGRVMIQSVQDLGAALRVARKALGLTQADLALAAGVGLRFVVDWKRANQRCAWSWCCG